MADNETWDNGSDRLSAIKPWKSQANSPASADDAEMSLDTN